MSANYHAGLDFIALPLHCGSNLSHADDSSSGFDIDYVNHTTMFDRTNLLNEIAPWLHLKGSFLVPLVTGCLVLVDRRRLMGDPIIP
jgi:hypothetical protein